ncbi:MAG: hypothetical protein LWW81_09365 [Rhodocyclales bacterium]|nr:hypothetical protein [Rhodocyclales bacterium]
MLTNRTRRKKLDEAHFFNRARALVECWPDGVVDADGEGPDIVVTTSAEKYGVEVTELLRENTRAVEETRRLICQKAQMRFLRRVNADCLDVKVVFRGEFVLNPRAQEIAAEEIAAIVLSQIRGSLSDVWGARLECGDDFESDLVAAIWLHHHPACPRSLWQPVSAWWVPIASVETVREAVDRKEDKLAAYRLRAPSVWLLIVVQGFSGARAWSVDDAVFAHRFHSSFDGVVLLDYAMNRAHILNTT